MFSLLIIIIIFFYEEYLGKYIWEQTNPKTRRFLYREHGLKASEGGGEVQSAPKNQLYGYVSYGFEAILSRILLGTNQLLEVIASLG